VALSVPETRYARSGDVNIAYQVFGDGETTVVWVPGFAQHLELNWEEPYRRAWFEGLARFARVILLDKRGTGLSDRVEGSPPLEVRMDDIRAVLDATGTDRAAVAMAGDSGPLGILFAATHAERTLALILCNAVANFTRTPDMPWLESREEYMEDVDVIARSWSDPDFWVGRLLGANPTLETDEERLEFSRPIRLSVSPGNMAQYLRALADTDVREILPTVRVPTLVLSRAAPDRPVAHTAAYLAERIPTARLVRLEGTDIIPVLGDREAMQSEIERFLHEVLRGAQQEPDRVLATVLFTDIVGSTAKAAELGDRGWRELLARHHDRIRRELSRFRGREVDTAGDGFFATFDGPARAIRCACAAAQSVSDLGIEIRAGVHTGECELVEGKVGGIAVHIGARVAAEAGPSEVLVSSTVKDLVAGSGLEFRERGAAELKGVPGEWRLYAVAR
jgi:class 3 adenylate cyclase